MSLLSFQNASAAGAATSRQKGAVEPVEDVGLTDDDYRTNFSFILNDPKLVIDPVVKLVAVEMDGPVVIVTDTPASQARAKQNVPHGLFDAWPHVAPGALFGAGLGAVRAGSPFCSSNGQDTASLTLQTESVPAGDITASSAGSEALPGVTVKTEPIDVEPHSEHSMWNNLGSHGTEVGTVDNTLPDQNSGTALEEDRVDIGEQRKRKTDALQDEGSQSAKRPKLSDSSTNNSVNTPTTQTVWVKKELERNSEYEEMIFGSATGDRGDKSWSSSKTPQTKPVSSPVKSVHGAPTPSLDVATVTPLTETRSVTAPGRDEKSRSRTMTTAPRGDLCKKAAELRIPSRTPRPIRNKEDRPPPVKRFTTKAPPCAATFSEDSAARGLTAEDTAPRRRKAVTEDATTKGTHVTGTAAPNNKGKLHMWTDKNIRLYHSHLTADPLLVEEPVVKLKTLAIESGASSVVVRPQKTAKGYKCPLCPYGVKTSATCQAHLLSEHFKQALGPCPHCNKFSTYTVTSYNRHVKACASRASR